jgi:hypothetical protein
MLALEAALDLPDFAPHMFTDTSLLASSPHSSLQWAVEVLAWSPDHLTAAADLLARLAKLDPGGRYGNRPVGSLAEIFKLWHPCTAASTEARQAALGALADNHPGVAWTILLAVLPHLMGVAMPTARPRWRDWAVEPAPTGAELAEAVAATVEILIRLADTDSKRWATIVELLDDVPQVQFEALLRGLGGEQVRGMPEEGRTHIWRALRDFVDKHTEFSDARWALPGPVIDRVRPLVGGLAPATPARLHGELFTDWPRVPGLSRASWDERQQILRELRQGVLRPMLEAGGLDSVSTFAAEVAAPATVGEALVGLLSETDQLTLLRSSLESEDDAPRAVGRGALIELSRARPHRLSQLLALDGWSQEARAELFCWLPFASATWKALEDEAPQVKQLYWTRVNVLQLVPNEPGAIETVTSALLEHELYEKAIHLVASHQDRATGALVVAVLIAAATSQRQTPLQLDQLAMDVPRLLKSLSEGDVPSELAADLEWAFLPLVHAPMHEPDALIERLRTDPEFFVVVLRRIYRRSDEEPRELNEFEKAQLHRGLDLLRHWRKPPGVSSDGILDEAGVESWVRHARELAIQDARMDPADMHIGQVLAYLPSRADRAWPPEVLGRILDEVRSPRLESGLWNGLYAKRGGYQKALREGGDQERALKDQYLGAAAKVAARYHRLARVLRSLAETYGREALAADAEAELE